MHPSVKSLKAVLDASILIQTVVREKYTDDTLNLVGVLEEIFVPSLVFYEISNAMVILTRRALIAREDAIRKYNSITSIPTLRIKEPTLTKAMDLAIDLGITLYDSSYLTLALETKAPFITADAELYEKGKEVTTVIHASGVKELYL